MKSKKRIALVDDHDLFRKGMGSLLKEFEEIDISMEAVNGKDLFHQLTNLSPTKHPHVILLDIQMPEMDGIETTMQLKKKYPAIKIIMLTMHNEEQLIYSLMEKGANGFLEKNTDIEVVVDAIYSVIEKGYYFNDYISKAMVKGVSNHKKMIRFNTVNALTDREIVVIRLICQQKTIKEIAEELSLSPRTIDSYRENIFLKTGAKNMVGIVFYAIEHNLLE
ncbi:MAG: DNA-binding response regulator [Bacteroidetes bacterium]|nr:DNA-binding response regulator [Bacteroidota bacterium]